MTVPPRAALNGVSVSCGTNCVDLTQPARCTVKDVKIVSARTAKK